MARFKAFGRLLSDAFQGVRGHLSDYPISQAIVLLGIPMVVEMGMESLFAVTDIFYVGHLGPNAIASIGLTESLLTFEYALACGLGIGATAIISRRIGEQDNDGAAVTAIHVLALGALMSVFMAALGLLLAPQFLRWMGASPDLVTYALPYTRIIFGGNVVIAMLFVATAIFRAAGDGAIAMKALVLSNGINLLLVPCLVKGILFFPELGLTGAATATTSARAVGVLYALWHFCKGRGRIHILRRHWIWMTGLMSQIIRNSMVGAIQIFIESASWFALLRIVSAFGSDVIAGLTIGIRLILFALIPAFGLSHAAATIAGQLLGARQADRAEKAVWLSAFYNVGFLGFIAVCFVIFTPTIVGRFTQDASTQSYAVACLRTISPSFLLFAIGIVLNFSFNGLGDIWTPTWISLLSFWVFELPVAWLLSHPLGMGPQGVFIAVMVTLCIYSILSALIFRQGHWKNKTV